jgi:hypothetical protein
MKEQGGPQTVRYQQNMNIIYRICMIAFLASCVSGPASAKDKDFAVAEQLIVVSPQDENGLVVVSGPKGTVRVGPAATAEFTIENRSLKPRRPPAKGVVGGDGSFSARIPGMAGDKIKLRISSLAGGGRGMTFRVPQKPIQAGRLDKSSLFSQSPPRAWLRPAEPTPEIKIQYRDSSSKPAASPLDPDREVRQSGVLPPD